ncbi:hypothetical protein BHE74_00006715 [Ensete ventricosum]|nr:hypothetical protein GW17_00028945 [Ensete ventricosum]RWW84661.1 hypothetical protein BHE74_00006715 [Ensete ventricosum]
MKGFSTSTSTSFCNPILWLSPSRTTFTLSLTTSHRSFVPIRQGSAGLITQGIVVDPELKRQELEAKRPRSAYARSTKGVDLSWTYAKDVTAKFEGVTSDTGDLADVVSHEEVGAMDGRIAGPTKEGCARLAVNRRPFIALHLY